MQEDKRLPIKVVGRKGTPRVDVIAIDSMQRAAKILRQGCPFIPKGVWRFKSFEEANRWTMEMLTRPRNHVSRH